MIHGTPKKFIFIHSISIPQYYRLFMCLRKLTSDQKIQKSTQTIHTHTHNKMNILLDFFRFNLSTDQKGIIICLG